MSTYALHPEAIQDLSEIWEFIAEDNVTAADRVIGGIFETIRTLTEFPLQGHTRPDLTASPLRFQLFREFLIAYAPNEHPLLVIAVLHGRRNPRVMSAILRKRR